MAKYGSDDVTITVNAQDLSDYIDTFNGLDIEAMLQESHAFGDEWTEHLFSGVKKGNEITFAGFYDDVANGPDATLDDLGATVPVVLAWGGTKTSSFDALIRRYRRAPTRGESSRFEAALMPSGEIVEV